MILFRLMMSSLNALQEKIVSVCKSRREIIAAYLFGSCARGKGNKANDVDIALLLDDDQEAHFPYLEFKVLRNCSGVSPACLRPSASPCLPATFLLAWRVGLAGGWGWQWRAGVRSQNPE